MDTKAQTVGRRTASEWVACSCNAGGHFNIECRGRGNDDMPIATLKGPDRKANAEFIARAVNGHAGLLRSMETLVKDAANCFARQNAGLDVTECDWAELYAAIAYARAEIAKNRP